MLKAKPLTIAAVATFAALASLSAQAKDLREADVPEAVRAAVAQALPNAQVTEWDFDDGRYEAELREGRLEAKLELSPEGRILKSKRDVAAEAIPTNVREEVLRRRPGAEILGANLHEEEGKTWWDVGVKLENGRHKNEIVRP